MTFSPHHDYLTEEIGPDGHPVRYRLDCPDDFNFAYDVVDRLGRLEPDRLALRWSDQHGARADYSFADVADLSDRAAAYFASLGIAPGDRVLVILKRRPEFWWALLGLHKLGAVALPATHLLKAYDLVYRLRQANIVAVVATLEADGLAREVELAEAELALNGAPRPLNLGAHGRRPGWLDFDLGLAQAPPWTRPATCQRIGDPMLAYFTSGTTADPKLVTHDFAYPIAHIPTAKYWQRVDPDGLHLTVSESGWAKAVWGKLYGQWLMAAAVDVYDFDRFDPRQLLDHIVAAGVTSFCAAPTVYRFLIGCDLKAWDLSRLTHCAIAGEAMNPVVYETFRDLTGIELKEAYGQTETTATVMTPYWLKTKAGSMGQPSPAYDVVLLTADGSQATPGQEGEICLRADPPAAGGRRQLGLFQGYVGDDRLTAQVWHDGFYHTRDLALRDQDGYLWYVGRTDDMIKTSGYRVSPFEVESVVLQHPAVREVAVTGVYDEVRGAVIKATVVPHHPQEAGEALAADIKAFVKSRTAPYKYPRLIEFCDQLPMTISGKIRRGEIRRRDALAAAGAV
ncbi:MAG: AMP-binding protein [Propionibacteriaceae bacterium]|jgi:acetyl-CoA synthetase|nr:AMP-binding protein [Propionibacteriaceae bacterium]